MPHVIIGTAGHIDHGKSALVKALTGTDPDRLIEEKERGLTIDIGFAFLNDNIAFIDVPGHEKFIKNMVAGVSTIDMAMLVVAADDGVMPQTIEHLDILSLLRVKEGLIVITKSDLADNEFLELVKDDVSQTCKGTFLEHAPFFIVSSLTGKGMPALKDYILHKSHQFDSDPDRGIFWLPVDRVFTIKGFGTVVTGSVLSGTVHVGDTLELLPAQERVKVRGLETHGHNTERIGQNERAAINLQNIPRDEIKRGNVLATPDYVHPSKLFDVKLKVLSHVKKPLVNGSKVRFHIGTQELIATVRLLSHERIDTGESGYAQIQLPTLTAARRHDPFVIRQFSPMITIGGGIILDIHPKRHKRYDTEVIKRLEKMEKQDPLELLSVTLLSETTHALNIDELSKRTGILKKDIYPLLVELEKDNKLVSFGKQSNPLFFHKVHYDQLKHQIKSLIENFHRNEPLRPGMSKAELRTQLDKKLSQLLIDTGLNDLKREKQILIDNNLIKSSTHSIRLSFDEEKMANNILDLLYSFRYKTPSDQEMAAQLHHPVKNIQSLLGALQGQNKILRTEGDIYFHSERIKQAEDMLNDFASQQPEISVSQFREMLDTSRRYAMALLAFFDQQGKTERTGDVRIINIQKKIDF